MTYHYYDMGFKDGYKKALNEQQMAALPTQTAQTMQQTVKTPAYQTPINTGSKNGGKGGSYNREAPEIKKLDKVFGISILDILNQYLEFLGLEFSDLIRQIREEYHEGVVHQDEDGEWYVIVNGVRYYLNNYSSGWRYTDEDGITYNLDNRGRVTSVSYPNGVQVFIGRGLRVYPYGIYRPVWWQYDPDTGEWEFVDDSLTPYPKLL